MNDLKFIPYEKVLINLNQKQRTLTEKKINSFYFCSNKNIELTKNDLLSSIWGFQRV